MSPPPFSLSLHGSAAHTTATYEVARLTGREALSRLFRFDLAVPITETSALLGERATLSLHGDGLPLRRIHGVVDRLQAEHGGCLRIRLVPRLARLRRRRTRRVFQDRTTVQIAATILAEWQLPLHARLARELPHRAYCVQYDETDLAFLERLFAEDGLFYGFEHADEPQLGDVLLLADGCDDLPPIDGNPALTLRPEDAAAGARLREDSVTELVVRRVATVGRARVRGVDHRRPLLTLEDVAGGSAGPETLDEDEGSYEDDLPLRPARLRLDAETARGLRFDVRTHCRRIEPLRSVSLEEAGGDLVVAAVQHEGQASRLPDEGARYHNRVQLLPRSATPRPRRRPPKPRQVSETATVVGPPGSEIHMDEQGRIKVRFPWDRDACGDETSSCWLRVLTPWAGAGWGVQFTPRVGMEVLVTFIGGDVDRPVCAGALANAVHPMPFGAELSGIRTQSTPGGGNHNELSFDDHSGAERLILHAARDLQERAGGDRTSSIAGGRDTRIGGGDLTRIGGDSGLLVGADRVSDIGGKDVLTVGSSRKVAVSGDTEVVTGGSERRFVGEDRVLEILGRSVSIVGGPEDPSHRDEYVYGSSSLGAQDRVVLRSDTALELSCGEASIEILPDRIVLRAPAVHVAASEQLTCSREDGPSLVFADGVELLTQTLRVFTERGALELDTELRAKADAIRLGYDPSKPPWQAGAQAEEVTTLRLELTDEAFQPHACCHYHLVVDGRRFEGVTDTRGVLAVQIPKGVRSAALRLWERDYPTGPVLSYAVELGELPPSGTLGGLRARLRNLGYYDGGAEDAPPDAALSEALRDFQSDHADTHGLDAHGEPDAPSHDALADVHGA